MDAQALQSESLSLCQFLCQVAKLGDQDFEFDPFRKLVQRLDIEDQLIQEHTFFTEESYARNLIFLTPRFEMVCMCWKPGQLSTIHDHLDSFALTKVIRGTLLNELYHRTDGGSNDDGHAVVEQVRQDLIPAGDWLTLGLGAIHRMGNAGDAAEDLVTLHFYARPLREIHVFDAEKQQVERVRLVYSLLHF